MSNYKLKIQLTVLDELGVNLYSNTPAMLSELVANSWDADAENVKIDFDFDEGKITIEDDGCGMDTEALQNKFLNVGYRKRGGDRDRSPKHERRYMGRKGIGKLSMFSIANVAEVQSVVKIEGVEKFRGGVRLQFNKIKEQAEHEQDYVPDTVNGAGVEGLANGGTRIILTDLKVNISKVAGYLKTRLARRFSVIDSGQKFSVLIGGKRVTAEDRKYFHKLQEVWWYGEVGKNKYEKFCKKLGEDYSVSPAVKCSYSKEPLVIEHNEQTHVITGWIGAVAHTGQISDEDNQSLNKLILLVRGKLAHEDLLPQIGDDRVYRQYLMGELSADFLDDTNEDDIALASRQGLKEGDERFSKLCERLSNEVKTVITSIAKLRKAKVEKTLLDLPAVEEWMGTLSKSSRVYAKKILQKVVKDGSSENEQKTIVKHTIIAFEYLDHQQRLEEIDEASDDEIQKITQAFSDINRLEATMYGEIASGRIKVIEKLKGLIGRNALEKELQALVAENLWLLNTSWERAVSGGEVIVEKSIRTAWEKGVDKEDVENGRIDIVYRSLDGKDIIIELKRAQRSVDFYEILKQCNKYIDAHKVAKMLVHGELEGYSVDLPETVILLGKLPKGWDVEAKKKSEEEMLKIKGIRVRTYQNLLNRAQENYSEYLEKEGRTNQLRVLIDSLDVK